MFISIFKADCITEKVSNSDETLRDQGRNWGLPGYIPQSTACITEVFDGMY